MASRLQSVPRRPLLWLCGVLTILLVLFAYVLALAMVYGLCELTAYLVTSATATYIILSLGSLTCAVTILWSLLPRPDRFTPPGPEIDAASQPRLFSEISAIAAEFREPMPASVYLMFDANAWVAQRGGMLGFGSRRVMALGYPLLAVLTVSEFRAVIAHEFAHYYGGDTGFGPWTNKAREAIVYSLQRLSSDSGFLHSLSRWAYIALLRWLVVGTLALYWKLFLRLTLLVSRQWEYRADELASAVAGAKPLLEGLRKLTEAQVAWVPYWSTEGVPSWESGFRPPLAEGFTRFLSVPGIQSQLKPRVMKELDQETPEAFDTHPTFRQRSERALSHDFPAMAEENSPALTLLDGVPELEVTLLRAAFPNSGTDALRPVLWEAVGATVYVPNWRESVAQYRELLVAYRAVDVPDALANLPSIAAQILDPKGMLLTRDQRAERAAALLWMGLAVALLDHGWELHAQPGDFYLQQGRERINPADLVRRMRQGIMSAEGYRDLIRHLGVAELRLAPSLA
jgi:Zn-dependent protease with chaperone function